MPLLLHLQESYIDYLSVRKEIKQADDKMKLVDENPSYICKEISEAWNNWNTEKYRQLYTKLKLRSC